MINRLVCGDGWQILHGLLLVEEGLIRQTLARRRNLLLIYVRRLPDFIKLPRSNIDLFLIQEARVVVGGSILDQITTAQQHPLAA